MRYAAHAVSFRARAFATVALLTVGMLAGLRTVIDALL